MSDFYYNKRWVLRTTCSGIEINPAARKYQVAWAYTRYIYYTIRDWFNGTGGPGDPCGPTGVGP